ncbi:MAG: cell division protein [Thaumarchaeota archaeon]|nr:cell division protein [Nitrososphaerota archaeon]
MKLGLIGLGQAGGRLLDLFIHYNYALGHKDVLPLALAINTAEADLRGLKLIPKKDRLLIGQTVVKGHGVGGDPLLGSRIAEQELRNFRRYLSERGTHKVDAFLLIAGVGGGTGSGTIPVFAKALKEVYSEPVYVLAVLPSSDEGKLNAANADRCINELSAVTDGIFYFDNELWRGEAKSLRQSFEEMNENIVKPLIPLFAAGEATSSGRIGVKVIDSSDIIHSLQGPTIYGYAEWARSMKETLKGFTKKALLVHKTSFDQLEPATRCLALVQSAASGKLSAEADPREARFALNLVEGHPEDLSREGMDASRRWLEEFTKGGDVRAGDYPIPRTRQMMSLIVFSGLTHLRGIERIREMAKEYVEMKQKKNPSYTDV